MSFDENANVFGSLGGRLMHKVFVGNTQGHEILFDVATHSIERRSQSATCFPISSGPLRELKILSRITQPDESTDFSHTRFLTPWLAGFKGWALYCDNDVVIMDDITELFAAADPSRAVLVVKHKYQPAETKKLNGKIQQPYPRKNWSSVVLWNCEHPKNRCLLPEFVNEVSGRYLHRFTWLEDSDIGALSPEWNFLAGWDEADALRPAPKLIHYTSGGPYFEEYRNIDFADLWLKEYESFMGRPFSEADYLT